MTKRIPGVEKSLAELHNDIIVRLAYALTVVRICRATAPFCDPAFAPLEDELAQALRAARRASAVRHDLACAIGDSAFSSRT